MEINRGIRSTGCGLDMATKQEYVKQSGQSMKTANVIAPAFNLHRGKGDCYESTNML
jgi:hypothetical protein